MKKILYAAMTAVFALGATAAFTSCGDDGPDTPPGPVTSVTIGGATAPVAGAAPDYTVKLPSGANYTLMSNSPDWWNITDARWMTSGEKFAAGKAYRLWIDLAPKTGSSFVDAAEMTAQLTGLSLSLSNTEISNGPDGNLRINFNFKPLPNDGVSPPQLTPGRITIKTNPAMLEHLLYINGSGNVEINWGDGTSSEVFPLVTLASNGSMNSGASAQFRHTYAAAAERTITITGYVTGISSGADDDRYTELKINEMPNLQYLVFYFQLLTGLDVSNNPKLRYMKLDVNDFHSLDVSNNPLLESLEVSSSYNLTALDVSKNPNLTRLSVGFTGITSLNVTKNPLLESLNYSGCSHLTAKPSLANNPKLESVSSNSNPHLPPPDLSANPVVGNFDIRYCELTAAQLVSVLNLFAGRDGSTKWLYGHGKIYLAGNPGINGTGYAAAKAAAVAKNWDISDNP